jgi:hypothetical protein
MWIANATARTAVTIDATIVSVGENAPSAAKKRKRTTSPAASIVTVVPRIPRDLISDHLLGSSPKPPYAPGSSADCNPPVDGPEAARHRVIFESLPC